MRSRSNDASQIGGSGTSTTSRHRRTDDVEDEETLAEKPATFDDFDEFSEDNDATPDDRRRDPLRKNF